MKNRKKYPKSCGNCVYRYSLFYPEHCFFRTTRVKENICDKYEGKIPLDDLVADTEIIESEFKDNEQI